MSEFFWLIEHRDSSPAAPKYLTTTNGIEQQCWRDSPFKAMRWKTQQAAQSYLSTFYVANAGHRVAEHGFTERAP